MGERRRVVITGVGCVSPLGLDASSTWDAAAAGRSGVRRITRFDPSAYPVHFAAELPQDVVIEDFPAKEARRLDRFILYALAAAGEALKDSGLEVTDANRDRIAIAIGSGVGGLESITNADRMLIKSGVRRVTPFAIPMTICNLGTGYVSMHFGLRGPGLCHVSACATASHSLGEAARMIERGDADVAVAGGSEAPIVHVGVAGFAAMKALSTRNDEPQRASRPFDVDRDGFVIGEGAGVMILESEEHARARGARVRAELAGYAATSDAHHLTQPSQEGAERCMRLALRDAGVDPSDVDYLNAHATSTPTGDVSEAGAIRSVFGHHTDRLPVSATKSMTGHLLGAAGAIEALFCLFAIENGLIPPTINLDTPDPECPLDHVAHKARASDVRVALSNSFGFGGTNAALVMRRWED